MAQTETWTNTGIAELILLLREEAATGMESIVALNDSGACTANVASTFADPAGTATHHVDEGLALQAIDTVGGDTTNTAGDTITFDHVFTATATRNVVGIHVCNNDDDVAFIECCFNAVLAMENTDTLTIDGQSTIDQA
jgi:hypothetical protein